MENPTVYPFRHQTPQATRSSEGITLLDHFAGLVMQAKITSGIQLGGNLMAKEAYKDAKHMLIARKEALNNL